MYCRNLSLKNDMGYDNLLLHEQHNISFMIFSTCYSQSLWMTYSQIRPSGHICSSGCLHRSLRDQLCNVIVKSRYIVLMMTVTRNRSYSSSIRPA